MHRHRIWLALLVAAVACQSPAEPSTPVIPPPSGGPPAPGTTPVRVLMVTSTAGFRHDSIPTARQVVTDLARTTGQFTVVATEDEAQFLTAAQLASFDVIMFALTSGELALDDSRKAAVIAFMNNGGGFIGFHSATDTFYTWADYGRLVGAYFKEHPWTQEAAVAVEDRAHPSTATLGSSFRLTEEFYTFRENPRPSVHVLLTLEAASVNAAGDFPLAWTLTMGNGRSYYNALGHFSATWTDPRFQAQIAGAIRWVAKRD